MQVSDFLSEHIVFNSTFANLSDTASSIDPSGLSSMFIGRNFFSFAMGKLLAGWSNITFALSVISELSSSYVQLDEYTAGGQYGHRYICNSKGQIIKIEKIL